MKRHAAPIIAAILLLLPVLYVGSYVVMVKPNHFTLVHSGPDFVAIPTNYRYGREFSALFFWPLEQIDRNLRPQAWEVGFWNTERPPAP